MAYLSVVSENKAEGDVKRSFEEIRKEERLPFVPNFFKTLAHAPQSLEAMWMAYRGTTACGLVSTAMPHKALTSALQRPNMRLIRITSVLLVIGQTISHRQVWPCADFFTFLANCSGLSRNSRIRVGQAFPSI